MSSVTFLRALAALVFLLSGCAALIFETVWFHVASTVLGSSVQSAAAVLAAFMAGLGLGNAAMAAGGQRIRRPLRWYVGIELVIASTGLATIHWLPGLAQWANPFLSELIDQPAQLAALRFALTFSVLLIPAIAMGATLPLVQKALHSLDASFSASIGKLYGWNTLGAVAGVLVTEFVLVEALGIPVTGLFAAGLNSLAALLMAGFLVTRGEQPQPPAAVQPVAAKRLRLGFALAATFMAGFVLLALEVIWFRYILLTQIGTSIVFAVMLAIVLTGLSLGGLLAARINFSGTRLDRGLVVIPVLSILAIVGGYMVYEWLTLYRPALVFSSQYLFAIPALVLVLPTSILSGMLFPMWGEKLYRTLQVNTSASGLLTVANTFGAALGSCVATFVLLPYLGVETSLLVLALVYLALSILAAAEPLRRDRQLALRLASLAVVGAALLVLFPGGSMERAAAAIAQQRFADEQIVHTREDENATLKYLRKDFMGQPEYFRLITDNYSMSSTDFTSRRYMELFVYIPYLLNPQIKDVLQISYGVGNTAEAIVKLKDIEHVSVVDTSQAILDLSELIHSATGIYPLRDPRVAVHVEDGRFFLQTTPRRFDLITGEPPPPKMARISNLYSQEYFALVKSRLRPGGLVSYWLPTHNLYTEDTQTIVRAFCEVFTDCSLWNGSALDFILVGSRGGVEPLTEEGLDAVWASPVGELLKRIGVESPGQFAALFLAGSETLRELTQGVAPITDDFPKRISAAYHDVMAFNPFYARLLDLDRRRLELLTPARSGALLAPALRAQATEYLALEGYLTGMRIGPMGYLADRTPDIDDILGLLRNTDNQSIPLLWMGLNPLQAAIVEGLPASRDPDYLWAMARVEVARRDYAGAADTLKALLEQGVEVDPFAPQLYFLAAALRDGGISAELRAALNRADVGANYRLWLLRQFAPSAGA